MNIYIHIFRGGERGIYKYLIPIPRPHPHPPSPLVGRRLYPRRHVNFPSTLFLFPSKPLYLPPPISKSQTRETHDHDQRPSHISDNLQVKCFYGVSRVKDRVFVIGIAFWIWLFQIVYLSMMLSDSEPSSHPLMHFYPHSHACFAVVLSGLFWVYLYTFLASQNSTALILRHTHRCTSKHAYLVITISSITSIFAFVIDTTFAFFSTPPPHA